MRTVGFVFTLLALHIAESAIDEGKLRMIGLRAEARNWEEQERFRMVNAEDLLRQGRLKENRVEHALMVEAHKQVEAVYKEIHDSMTAL